MGRIAGAERETTAGEARDEEIRAPENGWCDEDIRGYCNARGSGYGVELEGSRTLVLVLRVWRVVTVGVLREPTLIIIGGENPIAGDCEVCTLLSGKRDEAVSDWDDWRGLGIEYLFLEIVIALEELGCWEGLEKSWTKLFCAIIEEPSVATSESC